MISNTILVLSVKGFNSSSHYLTVLSVDGLSNISHYITDVEGYQKIQGKKNDGA